MVYTVEAEVANEAAVLRRRDKHISRGSLRPAYQPPEAVSPPELPPVVVGRWPLRVCLPRWCWPAPEPDPFCWSGGEKWRSASADVERFWPAGDWISPATSSSARRAPRFSDGS